MEPTERDVLIVDTDSSPSRERPNVDFEASPPEVMEDFRSKITAKNNIYLWQFVSSTSLGIVLALYTDYTTDLICDGNSSQGSLIAAWAAGGYQACNFLSAPVFGILSDSGGRRDLLIFSMCVYCIISIVRGLFDYAWVFISMYCVGGIFNGSTLLSTTVLVDYAMSTPPDLLGSVHDSLPNQFLCWLLRDHFNKRNTTHEDGIEKGLTHELSILFTIMWAYVILGTITGVILGAYLEDWIGLKLGMASAGILPLPVVLYTILYFEETAPLDRKTEEFIQGSPGTNPEKYAAWAMEIALKAMNQLGDSLAVLTSSNKLIVLSLSFFFIGVGLEGIVQVLMYWAEFKFSYLTDDTVHQAILYIAFVASAVASALLMNSLLFHVYGYQPTITGILIFSAVGCAILIGCTDLAMAMILMLPIGAATAVTPSALAVISPEVPHEKQGFLQGAVAALVSMSSIFGKFFTEWVFYHTTSNYDDSVEGTKETRLDVNANYWWLVPMCNFVVGSFFMYFAPVGNFTLAKGQLARLEEMSREQ